MIRINLRELSKNSNNEDLNNSNNPDFQLGGDVAVVDDGGLKKEAIKHLIIIMLGPFSLFAYEQTNIPKLKSQLNSIRNEMAQVSEKNRLAEEAVAQTRKLKKEQDVLQSQINAIENLRKDRSRVVQLLEMLQRNTPSNLWLSDFDFNDSNFLLSGYSMTPADYNNFLDIVQNSFPFVEEAVPGPLGDHSSERFGVIKKFEIKCKMRESL